MTVSNKGKNSGQAHVKKNLKNVVMQKRNDVLPLGSHREFLALEAIHSMFLRHVSKKTNAQAFERKKNVLDEKTLLAGSLKALEECTSSEH